MTDLSYVPEPSLLFNYGQTTEDPRDGLTLFGPVDSNVTAIRTAAIGTTDGLRRLQAWVERMQGPIPAGANPIARPHFPGFNAAFRATITSKPVLTRTVPEAAIATTIRLADRHERVHQTVDLFAQPIINALNEEDARPDMWLVIIPDDVYRYCRPAAHVDATQRIATPTALGARSARRLQQNLILFSELEDALFPYSYEPDFHNQLKAKLLPHQMPVQIIKESTIAWKEILNSRGAPLRELDAVASDIAWNLASACFYKAGGRPWKLAHVREGVCYLGIVFKRDDRTGDRRNACCAAQLFLDSGDGTVFRGAIGPWYSPRDKNFHLSRLAARSLMTRAVESYTRITGSPPSEMFIHGKIRFSDEEWNGFADAVPRQTQLTGIRIQTTNALKLYRWGTHPALRGIAYLESAVTAYLWTRGYIPRLRTYPGREVPRPLQIEICRGTTDITVVLRDILALTKLNYNSCRFADGEPVTLRFADAIGEILTAGPSDVPPLPFKYYI